MQRKLILLTCLVSAVSAVSACGGDTSAPIGGGSDTSGGDLTQTASQSATSAGSSAGTPSAADSTTAGAAFPPRPEGCGDATVVDPWLHIDGTELDERDSLAGASTIDGDLVVYGVSDTDLSFLECLTEVTGDLVLYDNDALVDTTGLTWIEQIGGDIIIVENDALVSFDALTLVTELHSSENPEVPAPDIDHALVIKSNAQLESIDGLANLVVVPGHLQVRDNPNLGDIAGLVGVVYVGGRLVINHNPQLCQSQVDALGDGLDLPDDSVPPDWSVVGNAEGC